VPIPLTELSITQVCEFALSLGAICSFVGSFSHVTRTSPAGLDASKFWDYGISGAVLLSLSDDDCTGLLGLSDAQLSRLRFALRDVRAAGGEHTVIAPPSTGTLPSARVPSMRKKPVVAGEPQAQVVAPAPLPKTVQDSACPPAAQSGPPPAAPAVPTALAAKANAPAAKAKAASIFPDDDLFLQPAEAEAAKLVGKVTLSARHAALFADDDDGGALFNSVAAVPPKPPKPARAMPVVLFADDEEPPKCQIQSEVPFSPLEGTHCSVEQLADQPPLSASTVAVPTLPPKAATRGLLDVGAFTQRRRALPHCTFIPLSGSGLGRLSEDPLGKDVLVAQHTQALAAIEVDVFEQTLEQVSRPSAAAYLPARAAAAPASVGMPIASLLFADDEPDAADARAQALLDALSAVPTCATLGLQADRAQAASVELAAAHSAAEEAAARVAAGATGTTGALAEEAAALRASADEVVAQAAADEAASAHESSSSRTCSVAGWHPNIGSGSSAFDCPGSKTFALPFAAAATEHSRPSLLAAVAAAREAPRPMGRTRSTTPADMQPHQQTFAVDVAPAAEASMLPEAPLIQPMSVAAIASAFAGPVPTPVPRPVDWAPLALQAAIPPSLSPPSPPPLPPGQEPAAVIETVAVGSSSPNVRRPAPPSTRGTRRLITSPPL